MGVIAFIATLLLNGAYEHWEGGWTYGTRHLMPTLGFIVVGAGAMWDIAGPMRPVVRVVMVLLVLVGGGSSLVAVSTTPQPPAPEYKAPMRELMWPSFRAGNLSINTQSYLDQRPVGGWGAIGHSNYPHAAWNLGEKAGLHGLGSLVPLGLLLAAGLAVGIRGLRET
jgi:hypothetical protein